MVSKFLCSYHPNLPELAQEPCALALWDHHCSSHNQPPWELCTTYIYGPPAKLTNLPSDRREMPQPVGMDTVRSGGLPLRLLSHSNGPCMVPVGLHRLRGTSNLVFDVSPPLPQGLGLLVIGPLHPPHTPVQNSPMAATCSESSPHLVPCMASQHLWSLGMVGSSFPPRLPFLAGSLQLHHFHSYDVVQLSPENSEPPRHQAVSAVHRFSILHYGTIKTKVLGNEMIMIRCRVYGFICPTKFKFLVRSFTWHDAFGEFLCCSTPPPSA